MSIWQTKEWSEMLIKSNQAEKVFDIKWIKIEKRKISLWEYWLFIQWLDFNIDIKNELIDLCKKESCLFIQIETLNYANTFEIIQNFSAWYYKKFMPYYTVIIDLDKSEDEILSQMKPKWRYNIKLAIKKWIKCKIVEKTEKNINIFYNLVLETIARDSFSWNSLNYYKTFLNNIKESELIFAYKEKEVIASGIFILHDGVALYYYWASSSKKEYRNLMAPYFLQWTAIKEAKRKWCKFYDFLGVMTPWSKDSSLKWVTAFKLKFNKNSIKISDSYIWINKRFKYFLVSILKKIKKLISKNYLSNNHRL